MSVLPRADAIETALRLRRLQLAHALVPGLGTQVRHGLFRSLDLGTGLLQRPAPLARLLGMAPAGWPDHALALCRRRTHLLHLGAPDGFVAAGLLQTRLVERATVLPLDEAAARAVQDDAQRLGLTDTLHCLPPQPAPVDWARVQHAIAAAPHALCLAENGADLARWLSEAPAVAWDRLSLLWPAAADAADPALLALLRARLGEAAAPSLLGSVAPQVAPPTEAPAGLADLASLDATDRTLVTGEAGPARWWWVDAPAAPQRRRSLLCTSADDRFVSRLLETVRWDEHEPLAVDVLVYGLPGPAEPGAPPADYLTKYPAGVRVFQLPTALGQDGVHAVDDSTPVLDARGHELAPAREFFEGYERFAVWSLNRFNAGLVRWLSQAHGRERLMLLVSDDEVDLRHRALQFLASGQPALVAAAQQRFPASLEAGFEAVRHFWVARRPWEELLRWHRKSDLQVHPLLLPIKNDLSRARGVRPPDDRYVLMLHPKPALPRDEAMAWLEGFLQRWQVDRPLQVLTLRNDLASCTLPLPGGRGQATLRVFPVPLPEPWYFELMAGCHGLVLVPRGGMTSTREAVRLGLDLFDDGADFSPNRSTLRDGLGLHIQGGEPITVLRDGHVGTPAQRGRNQQLLARHEHAAVAAFRSAFL